MDLPTLNYHLRQDCPCPHLSVNPIVGGALIEYHCFNLLLLLSVKASRLVMGNHPYQSFESLAEIFVNPTCERVVTTSYFLANLETTVALLEEFDGV